VTRARWLAVLQWAMVCVAVWFATPPQRSTPLRVLAVGSFVFVAGWAATATMVGRRVAPVVRADPDEPPPPSERQVRLARLETSLWYAEDSAAQYYRSVAPMLRELVTERLLRRHGIDIETAPAAARAIMGEELWQLYDVPPGARPDGPGPPPAWLAGIVAAVERV